MRGTSAIGDAAVPDAHGIDHNGWPVLALVEAAGMVRAYQSAVACRLQLFLERVAQSLLAFGVAAATPVAWLTNISAYEDMMGERRHWGSELVL